MQINNSGTGNYAKKSGRKIRYVFNFKLPAGWVAWQQESEAVHHLIIVLSFDEKANKAWKSSSTMDTSHKLNVFSQKTRLLS